MDVVVQQIRNTVEIVNDGSVLEVRQVRNVVDVTAPGPQGATGPQGPQGPAGDSSIGGYPVVVSGLASGDVLQFQSQQWQNTPQSNLTDGGNF